MPDLHGWITQQIDDRERLARRAAALCGCHPSAPVWSFHDGDEPTDGRILVVDDPHPSLRRRISRKWSTTYEGLFMAEHIVANDPHAVLRRCAADRKILAEHRPQGGGYPSHYACEGCGYDGSYCPEPNTDHVNDCPTLLALAEGYGLTEEQRAALDRPEPERPTPTGPSLIPDGLAEAMYGNLYAFALGVREVERRPEVKAMEILAPELKKIPGYLPTTEEQP
jgi:hypothetical protein